jgi:hypothetical protein
MDTIPMDNSDQLLLGAEVQALDNPYSAEHPSPRYAVLIDQYKNLHQEVRAKSAGQGQMFEGIVGFSIVAPYIRRLGG